MVEHDFSDPYSCVTFTGDGIKTVVRACKRCGVCQDGNTREMCVTREWRTEEERLNGVLTAQLDRNRAVPASPNYRPGPPAPMLSGLGAIGCRMIGRRK